MRRALIALVTALLVVLEAWIPGLPRPYVSTSGVRAVHVEQVPGGWLLRATPVGGHWALSL